MINFDESVILRKLILQTNATSKLYYLYNSKYRLNRHFAMNTLSRYNIARTTRKLPDVQSGQIIPVGSERKTTYVVILMTIYITMNLWVKFKLAS